MTPLREMALGAILVTLTFLTSEVKGQQAFQDEVLQRLDNLENNIWTLSRATLMQQVAKEEFVRGQGDSGINLVRNYRDGPRAYHAVSHTGWAAAAFHDHAPVLATCGMGEIEAVLNGVHFRTRHNDYLLVKPSEQGAYHAVEPIAFPAVPPAVLNAGNVQAQITEMREWFKAWQSGDASRRDYRPYFKPLLCYLEGAWTQENQFTLTEPFKSELHAVDAWSWWDLQEKNRFTAWTGDMDFMENYAHLPMAPVGVKEDGTLELAQWNYRILFHPIQGGLEVRELELVDDISARLSLEKRWSEYALTRAPRFYINRERSDQATYEESNRLDELMAQIPGKDNYVANIRDTFLNQNKKDIFGDTLNAGFYHRSYKMYDTQLFRGFNDRNLYVAQTTQAKVTPIRAEFCDWDDKCSNVTKRVSYAIPLEVVYLTPLNSWNPYNIQYKGHYSSNTGKTVTANGRNGGFTQQTAYDGTNSMNYYLTPAEFFSGPEVEEDTADSAQTVAGVLDSRGNVRNVTASSIRILLPEIPGVGIVRTRYPIFPVYAEGSTTWKETEALAKIVMDLEENSYYLHKSPAFN